MELTALSKNNEYLSYLDIHPEKDVFADLCSAQLVERALTAHEGNLSQTGAFIVETGVYTGRSPNDKFIVNNKKPADSQIAWGSVNKAIAPENFDRIYHKVKVHLEKTEIYIQDVIVGRDPAHAQIFRIVSEYAWATLFTRNLLLPALPEPGEKPDFTLLHVPTFNADPDADGTHTRTFIIINFDQRLVLIGGTSYAGEIKKSIFTVMNRILPDADVFPMHCSANIGKSGDTALFFGLSGTGKTTLSSSPDRYLIGDDEHGWSKDGIFNFENGCYAKTINLSRELEPMIWEASQRFGSVLENVGFDPATREIDFYDGKRTENTRAAYPILYIDDHIESGRGNHPQNIFFLSADAFGVLPPISYLTNEQAVYYFLLGYTAKLAGTEKGLGTEPEATFSTCFGEPFLPLSPVVYANLLLNRIKEHKPNVWLINTGWSGGPYGTGSRIKLPYSRAMISAVLDKGISEDSFHRETIFGLRIPTAIESVPSEILDPINTWQNKADYLKVADNLIEKMHQRMARFNSALEPAIINSGPHPRN